MIGVISQENTYQSKYWIADGEHIIERHDTERGARKAFWILTAHEILNNRQPNFVLHGSSALPVPWGDLGSWAVDALKPLFR